MLGVALWLCAGCGQHSAPTAEPDLEAGPPQHWFVVLDKNAVELVSVDERWQPTLKTLATFDGYATGAFSNDGTRFAYSECQGSSHCDVHALSFPDGVPFAQAWQVPVSSAPDLTWVGNEALLTGAGTSYTSQLLQWDEPAEELGVVSQFRPSADRSAALAVAGDRLLYVADGVPAQWSQPLQGRFDAYLSQDGQGIALFTQDDLPIPRLQIPATYVLWLTDLPASCFYTQVQPCPDTPVFKTAAVDWPTHDAPIVAEFDAFVPPVGPGMQLVKILPFAGPHLQAPPRAPLRSGGWGITHDGNTFILENPEDPTTEPWSVALFHDADPLSRFIGPIGSASHAIANSDESALFVVGQSKRQGALAKDTVYVVAYPPTVGVAFDELLTTTESVRELHPQPGGPGVLIVLGTQRDFVSDGHSPAVELPYGTTSARWLPDGQGLLGDLDGYVVYVSLDALTQPRVLAKGSFVLPSHW